MWLERWECDGAWYRGDLERDGTGIFVSCMGCNTFFHYPENEGGKPLFFSRDVRPISNEEQRRRALIVLCQICVVLGIVNALDKVKKVRSLV